MRSRDRQHRSYYTRSLEYARREVARVMKVEAQGGSVIGFRVHPEFGWCWYALRCLDLCLVWRSGQPVLAVYEDPIY